MPVRQALNAVYARCVQGMDGKERKRFDDDLYGWSTENRAGNDALRDIREIDESLTQREGEVTG